MQQLCFMVQFIGYTTLTRRFSVYTKPQSGCSVTGLYHRMYAQLFLMNINTVVYGVLTLH